MNLLLHDNIVIALLGLVLKRNRIFHADIKEIVHRFVEGGGRGRNCKDFYIIILCCSDQRDVKHFMHSFDFFKIERF